VAKRRRLLQAEQNLFPSNFRNAINIGNVTFIYRKHSIFVGDNTVLTRNNKIYWPNCPDNFTKAGQANQSLLMHELCHVWQYHTGRLSAVGYIINPKRWKYEYTFDPKKTFDDYPTEKQADLLEDWYRLNKGLNAKNFKNKTTAPTKEQINKVVPFIWS